MLKGKTVILGVTGSIAAYKAANLASMLKKQHADVHVILTKNGSQFITPVTFETLTGNKCLTDTFDRNFEFQVEHVELAKRADLVIVAPATANIMAKLAWGLADDMLTTTVLACRCPKLIAPAMNTRMYENPVTQNNMELLKSYGWNIIEPAVGHLACGDTGAGKFPEEKVIVEHILNEIALEKDMSAMRVLVTAGPTMEAIDPVRFISNHSTGKMGYALAKICRYRGAEVTLVSGKTDLDPPVGVKRIDVRSAREMFDAVTAEAENQDIIIKAAAVADYRPVTVADNKLKKKDDEMVIELERTRDILAWLGAHKKENQILCGFAMETEHMVEHAREKLKKKNLDLIAANNVKVSGAGFGTDTNVVTMITGQGETELEMMSKEAVSVKLTDELLNMYRRKTGGNTK
ncbi:MAG: bifunctional phosphopantothenoylcysteine decarboxylase/phosphopantothenate--cysteine ligase CoaBC [Candidatus Choladocola sp.]|nr:bifunctional phosphopantothenoylcysteine decarboxylase/phosphopantothenate--cysteine ligase CoaBC [Candidatus Choladocola sp.]